MGLWQSGRLEGSREEKAEDSKRDGEKMVYRRLGEPTSSYNVEGEPFLCRLEAWDTARRAVIHPHLLLD